MPGAPGIRTRRRRWLGAKIGLNPGGYLPDNGGRGGIYKYGYPAYGNAQPNVKAQFLYDEMAGDLIDTVAALHVPGRGLNNNVYNVPVGGDYASLSPGISVNDAGNKGFATTVNIAALNIAATHHVVIEWWLTAAFISTGYHWSFGDQAGSANYQVLFYQDSATHVQAVFLADTAESLSVGFNITAISATIPSKFRLVLNRSGNLELFQNGVSKGTASAAAIAGVVFTNTGLGVPGQFNDGDAIINGTFFEWRASIGTDVLSNNSGGPSGG